MKRLAWLVRCVAAFVAFVAASAAVVGDAPSATAAGAATAVVVIDTGANVRAAIIHFDGSITGIDALELAGANPVTYGYAGQGAAVCELDGVGNPPDSCLVGPNGEYWAYWIARGGATSWTYSRGCACTTMVGDGDVEGWRYGTGAAPRSSASFCAYVFCPPPTTAAAPTTLPAGDGSGGSATGGGGATGQTGAAGGGGGSAGTGSGTVPSTPSSGGPGAEAVTGQPTGALGGTATSTTTAAPSTTRARHDGADRQVAAVARGGGGGDGPGSPVGVAVAAGALSATAVGAVALRRRRIRSTPS